MMTAQTDVRRRIEADVERETKSANYRALAAAFRDMQAEKRDPATLPPAPVNRLLAYFGPGYAEHYTQPEEVADISDADRAFAFSAEGEFLALSKTKTGESLSAETLTERRAASGLVLEQTHTLATRMEAEFAEIHARETETAALVAASVGADVSAAIASIRRRRCYRETPFGLWRYYVHSRHVEKLPAFSRMMFLPYVAQHVRGPILSALEFWLEKNPFARFWTFTSGARCKLSAVRARTDYLHRRLSLLNAEQFMRDAGIRIVFRSTELGTPETNANGHRLADSGIIERDESGEVLFHVHAHCVVEMAKGPLAGEKWKKLLARVHDHWGHNWDDGGSIRDARECCKYVTKPGEMLKLTGAELVALSEQLHRAKLVQPMGSLREEIKSRRDSDLRLVRRRTPDGPVYGEVKNWNKHGRRTPEEKAADAAAKLDRRSAASCVRILSRLLPGFGPSGVSEPRVVVMAQDWNESHVRAHLQVARLISATAHEFWAGSAIRVHTCTPTVGETTAFAFADSLPPPRHLPTGAEIAGLSR